MNITKKDLLVKKIYLRKGENVQREMCLEDNRVCQVRWVGLKVPSLLLQVAFSFTVLS